jgi:hypothetical protein
VPLHWLVQQLARFEVGLLGVFVPPDFPAKPMTWSWPLVVGCLATEKGGALAATLKRSEAIGRKLATVRVLGETRRECDILLLADPIKESLRHVLATGLPIRADIVVALGALREAWVIEAPLLDALRSEVRGGAAAHGHVAPRRRRDWLTRLIYNVCHDLPFDGALLGAAQRNFDLSGPEIMAEAPVLIAPHSFLDASRLNRRMERFARAMAARPPGAMIRISHETIRKLQLPKDGNVRSAAAVGAEMRAHLETGSYRFDHEKDEATAFAEVAAVAPPEPVKPGEGARYLLAQVDALAPEGPRREEKVFVAGARYAVRVHIGPPDKEWMGPASGTPFREPPFPPDVDRNYLTVAIAEPNHLPQGLVETLELPRAGKSDPVQFFITMGTHPTFDARITVLHKNRVLQTAVLRARVIAAPAEVRPQDKIEYDIEGVVRQQFSGLSGRDRFEVALIANHSSEGLPRLTALSESAVRLRAMDAMASPIKLIGKRLSRLSDDMSDVAKPSLKGKVLGEALRDLARHGYILHGALVTDWLPDGWVDNPGTRIQIVSAHPEAYLPLEFVYDKPSPSPSGEAKLCPKTEQAIEKGRCLECLEDNAQWRKYVCPLRFWGMRHIIERHAFDKGVAGALGGAEFALQREPVAGRRALKLPGASVYGASAKAEKVQAGLIARVFKALRAVAKPQATDADDWDAWVERVKKVKPSFLLMLPHTFDDAAGIPTLEIGKGKTLPRDLIDVEHLRVDEQGIPVVALLGCETAVVDKRYASFVAAFRQKGAALVICTLSTVLGRHAGKVAELILDELKGTGSERAISDVLLRVRHRSLAEGIPMGMSVVAYGDADWRI